MIADAYLDGSLLRTFERTTRTSVRRDNLHPDEVALLELLREREAATPV
jgi:hypothetical protein